MGTLNAISHIAYAGMHVQAERLKIVAQNVANADSRSPAPGVPPYKRKMLIFRNVLDRSLGERVVRVTKVLDDPTPFGKIYDPSSPVADRQGYVKTTNVNPLIERMDGLEAAQAYRANLALVSVVQTMVKGTIGSLR